jgi:hypothetical protein
LAGGECIRRAPPPQPASSEAWGWKGFSPSGASGQ